MKQLSCLSHTAFNVTSQSTRAQPLFLDDPAARQAAFSQRKVEFVERARAFVD